MANAPAPVPTETSSADGGINGDLWERAASRLHEKDKAFIVFNSTISLKDLMSTVEAEKRNCESNRLVVNRGADRDPIVLHEIFSKIVGWIEKFVAVGDTAMQYDTGHAALPWAVVRLVLQISIQDVRRYAAVVSGIENISRLIAYYSIMESIYFRRHVQATEEARNALVDLYTSILLFLAKTRKYLAKSSMRRVLGSMTDFENKIQSILRDITEKEATIQRYAVLMDAEYQRDDQCHVEAMNLQQKRDHQRLRDLLNDMQRPIDRMKEHLQKYEDGLEAKTRIQILSWLSPIPYLQHHIQANSDVLLGTGQWLLNDDRLLEWQYSRSSSILWLHGIPGSGKSKLVSIVIEHLLKTIAEGHLPYLAFFYCTRNPAERERASPETILRSLVRQLSCIRPENYLETAIRDLYNTRLEDGLAAGALNLRESTSMLVQLTSKRRHCHIIIDALDECIREEREHLLDALSVIMKESTGIVKVFISSRDDMDIVRNLAGGPNVLISAKNNQDDIATFVRTEVDKQIEKKRLLSGQVSEALRHKIKQVLCDQAQGMFRWVTLQLQYLCRIKVASLVERRLGKLPQDLQKIYHETYMERFYEYQKEEVAIVQSALRWLICSQEPLSAEAFLLLASSSAYQRPAMSLSRDDLLDLCFNFVVHDAELDVFRFSHLSVREYLEDMEPYQLESCHAFAAEYCLKVLTSSLDNSLEVLTGLDGWLGTYALKVDDYVCLYWPHHLKQSGVRTHMKPLQTLFSTFTMDEQDVSPHFLLWNEKRSSLQVNHRDTSQNTSGELVIGFPADPLFVACVWELEELLHWRINTNTRSLEVRNQSGMTALHITCKLGKVEAARTLIENGVNLEAMVGDETALTLATVSRHTGLMRLLIEKGASVNSGPGSCALEAAVRKDCLVEARTLLDLGADPSIYRSSYACCVFHEAVKNGRKSLVKKMLEKSILSELERKEWLARTQMLAAVSSEAELTALFRQNGFGSLLDQATLQCGLWKIIFFTKNGSKAARALVDAGADVNLGYSDWDWWRRRHGYQTATGPGFGVNLLETVVAKRSDEKFVELLLDSGALVDPPAFQGQSSPLESAVRIGRQRYAIMLMERGARIDRTDYLLATGSTDCFLGSLLDLAESRGHVAMARLLSERGVPSAVKRLTNQQFQELKKERVFELE